MAKITIIRDDLHIIAIRLPNGAWVMDTNDTSELEYDTKTARIEVPDDASMGAIMSLICGENEANPELNAANYAIAEPLLQGLSRNLLPNSLKRLAAHLITAREVAEKITNLYLQADNLIGEAYRAGLLVWKK